MTIRNLDKLLAPGSVAFAGASPEAGSVGYNVARNLLAGGFAGEIFFLNPKHKRVLDPPCHASVFDLPRAPDLAVIATPPQTVPGLIADFAKMGTRAAMVITAGLGAGKQQMLDAAKPSCFRILGPNCLGLMLPPLGLNASFAHRDAPKGDLAFLSQSGALIAAVIDWAATRNIGFSHVASLGDMADADFGDLLDYLAGDTKSRAILIYMEALTHAPKFISAARRAARVKPVIVVKSGRHEAGARAAASHTGALAGSDAAYDAAFRRTGLVRVKTLPDLFAAAEMLSTRQHLTGERLMILTNGGGAGVLAADELQDAGGTLASLSDTLKSTLNAVLPSTWSHANPADIIGDAGPDRYAAALAELLKDPASDAVLVMQCPTALASSRDNAEAVVATIQRMQGKAAKKPVLTCWLGDEAARDARNLFEDHAIPTFETPSDAVSGFMQIVRHARAQNELMQAPDGAPIENDGEMAIISQLIRTALAAGQSMLTAIDAKAIFKAAHIPIAESFVAANAEEVHAVAAKVLASNTACVIKILSPDISHKSDVGGVRLAIESADAARIAAEEMQARITELRPGARLDGFMVEPFIRRPRAHEVIVGMSEDPTFGPILLFGAGGTGVEVIADRALALPPLDRVLARQMIKETRIAKLLAGYRDRPPADMDAIVDCLVRISNLVVQHPEIRELDINPLLVDENGAIAIDARIRIADETRQPRAPLAIRPYPAAWERTFDLLGVGTICVRPVRPDDERHYEAFFSKISHEDLRMRFFTPRVELSHSYVARLTQIDYAREMAFVAIDTARDELLGVVRLLLEPDLWRGEYGILVRSDLKGKGLGWRLMQHLIDYASAEGVREIYGMVLTENTTMIDMARRMGFHVTIAIDEPGAVRVQLNIEPSDDTRQRT
ncbi:MAG: bifunctional acetate--CoA ligase family protein/GNAT family N-acetyltransferase [Hyphomicrobium sp.]|nr:bifunctional acetate--CoA ligase family protein/GNAT family N-acetyltransferase [Hyphomicrobium sp.]